MPNKLFVLLILMMMSLSGCKEEVLPKPKAMLRLEYPGAKSVPYKSGAFGFEMNQLATIKEETPSSLTLDYPLLKGAIFLNYKPVRGNLNSLLADAQKLSYEHVVKADEISEQPFINPGDKVYGMFYEVTGDAASQAQFYVTDSTNHFVTGSLYFYAKPNYDSIYPAAVYLQKDIRKIMETIRWE